MGNSRPDRKKSSESEAISIPVECIPETHGTIIIWSKYDRLREKYSDLIEEFKTYLGRTYRYFIWNECLPGHTKHPREFPVEIILNNKKIDAHDPLYVRTEKPISVR